MKIIVHLFSSLEKRRPECASSLKAHIIDNTKGNLENNVGDHFLTNGILKFNNEYYRTGDYCINGYDMYSHQARFVMLRQCLQMKFSHFQKNLISS